MKFSGKVSNGSVKKLLNFGGDPDTFWIQGLFSRFFTTGRYRKWYQPTALYDAAVLAGIAIATMTSLRHRPLAEVCTVPVLLVC